MEICNAVHDEIIHELHECPLCNALNDLEEMEKERNEVMGHLERKELELVDCQGELSGAINKWEEIRKDLIIMDEKFRND